VTTARVDPGSFRDRESRVFTHDGRVLRGLSPVGLAEWERLSASSFFGELLARGRVPATRRVELDPDLLRSVSPRFVAALEHERMPFVSYPYEWSFSMLRDAALLTLDVIAAAMAEGMILKDASPYNVQWKGARPVFIDIGSFEAWRPGEPWIGYRQFCRLFLYPLLLRAYKNVPFQPWLRGALDGPEPEHVAGLFTLRDALRPGVLGHVLLQARLARRPRAPGRSVRRDLQASGFGKDLILHNVAGLRRIVSSLRAPRERSAWSEYSETHSYSTVDYEAKKSFVEKALRVTSPRSVWDLGCNTGEFSRLAAAAAGQVVAIDGDEIAIDRLYRALAAEPATNVLPLVVPLTEPSADLGWRGRERQSLERRGSPDLVLALALAHHLVLSGNIPLGSMIGWLADLGAALVIEFVGKDDPMVERLLLDKIDNYDDWTRPAFEAALGEAFEIVDRAALASGTRFLYLARPRSQSIYSSRSATDGASCVARRDGR
jgi:SAM-dependent methyltransferase